MGLEKHFEFVKSVVNIVREDPVTAEKKYYLSYQPMFSPEVRSKIGTRVSSGSWNWIKDFKPDERGYWFFIDASNYSGLNYFRMINMLAGYRSSAG